MGQIRRSGVRPRLVVAASVSLILAFAPAAQLPAHAQDQTPWPIIPLSGHLGALQDEPLIASDPHQSTRQISASRISVVPDAVTELTGQRIAVAPATDSRVVAASETQPVSAHGEAPMSYDVTQDYEPLDVRAMVIRLACGTGLVLLACFASLWAGKKWLVRSGVTAHGQGRIQVLDSIVLASRCSLQLVQVDNQKLLVGHDNAGLKSVVPIAAPFGDTLMQIESTAAPDQPVPAPAGERIKPLSSQSGELSGWPTATR